MKYKLIDVHFRDPRDNERVSRGIVSMRVDDKKIFDDFLIRGYSVTKIELVGYKDLITGPFASGEVFGPFM